MHACWICEGIFGPERVHGVDVLQTFDGYTVDFQLKQFRQAPLDGAVEFVDFDSPLGTKLCDRMHEVAVEELGRRVDPSRTRPSKDNAG